MVCTKVLTFLAIYLWNKIVCFVLFVRLKSPKPWHYLLVLVLFASHVGVVAFFVFMSLFFSHKYNALLLLFYCSSCVVLLLFPHGVTTFLHGAAIFLKLVLCVLLMLLLLLFLALVFHAFLMLVLSIFSH